MRRNVYRNRTIATICHRTEQLTLHLHAGRCENGNQKCNSGVKQTTWTKLNISRNKKVEIIIVHGIALNACVYYSISSVCTIYSYFSKLDKSPVRRITKQRTKELTKNGCKKCTLQNQKEILKPHSKKTIIRLSRVQSESEKINYKQYWDKNKTRDATTKYRIWKKKMRTWSNKWTSKTNQTN